MCRSPTIANNLVYCPSPLPERHGLGRPIVGDEIYLGGCVVRQRRDVVVTQVAKWSNWALSTRYIGDARNKLSDQSMVPVKRR
ncbi:hypothetical protein KCU88_g379, partial [Aureobasidium melanogenum]